MLQGGCDITAAPCWAWWAARRTHSQRNHGSCSHDEAAFKTSGLGLKQRTLVSNASGGPFQGWKLREKGDLGDRGNGRLTGAAVCVCERECSLAVVYLAALSCISLQIDLPSTVATIGFGFYSRVACVCT